MFDFDQLLSFAMLAEERHFGRAARRSHVSQPAFSRRIQQLETAVGAELVARDGRSFALTAAGEALLPRARSLLRDREAAVREVRTSAGVPRGTVGLGFDGATTYAVLPRLIEAVRESGVPIGFEFVELSSDAQVDEIVFSRLDVGLVRPRFLPDGVVSERVASEPLALAIPIGHPLARRRRPRAEDLHGTDFIAYSARGDYLRALIDRALLEHGIVPRRVQEAMRAQSILSLVSIGLGIAIVPYESRRACFDNVVFRPLPFPMVADLHAAYRAGEPSDCVRHLLGILRSTEFRRGGPARRQTVDVPLSHMM